MRVLGLVLGAIILALPVQALAQHEGHATPQASQPEDMAGMDHAHMQHGPVKAPAKRTATPAKPSSARPAAAPEREPAAVQADPHAMHQHQPAGAAGADSAMPQMDHAAMPGMDHKAMDHSAMPGMDHGPPPAPTAKVGTDQLAGDAPAPAAPEPTYADSVWGREAMAAARSQLRREHGGLAFRQVNGNLLEYQVRDGSSGLRWDGEGWYGTDLDRLFVKSEGRTNGDEGLEDGELQLLYGRTIGPYTFLQAGVRQDFAPIGRTYASLGFETLVPYWIDLEGTVFVSTRGDLLARAEATYDLRLTQRAVLQPRVELNLAAQNDRAAGIGSGVSDLELGLRLRYEIRREFAPYIGVSYDRDFGDTARFTRARGEKQAGVSFVVGLRSWF